MPFKMGLGRSLGQHMARRCIYKISIGAWPSAVFTFFPLCLREVTALTMDSCGQPAGNTQSRTGGHRLASLTAFRRKSSFATVVRFFSMIIDMETWTAD